MFFLIALYNFAPLQSHMVWRIESRLLNGAVIHKRAADRLSVYDNYHVVFNIVLSKDDLNRPRGT